MAQRTNHVGGKHYNPLFVSRVRMKSIAVTATADMPIEATWPPVLLIDPGGAARTVLLPPEADCKDQMFLIINTADAAETLTVEEDGASTTIVALARNESAWVHCDGTTWRAVQNDIA